VRGQVLPVGGVTSKIEAAAEMGFKKVIIPRANKNDVLIEERYVKRIEVIPVETLKEVLDNALVGAKKSSLVDKLTALMKPATIFHGDRPVVNPH
jgi:Lon-like ATP-dependent protease